MASNHSRNNSTSYTNVSSVLLGAKINSPDDDSEVDPNSYLLEKFMLYETRARFYLIGSDSNKKFFRILKIDRSEPSELSISEDHVVYTQQEIKNLLQRISEGNKATGGLTFVAKVFGVVGCIKFLESYYLILVTKRRQIGSICGHAIYAIDESQLITIPHVSVQTDLAHSKTELRYKKLLSSVDLTKDFFYSYTYPIMRSLQKNVLLKDKVAMSYTNLFVWNAYLSQPIRSRCKNKIWTIALVHGHFNQVRFSIFGRDLSAVLISRRSRHFAGTRYLKRGVNDKGRVANDVETEQIVVDEDAGSRKGKMTSVVQMRGSIPLFWSQEATRFSPKPDIILQRYDPTYESTKLHFEDLAERYGDPIIVLNLIKTFEKRPREMMLRREFAHAVGYLNQILSEDKHLKFIHWDFHKFAKTKSANVLAVLGVVASEALDLTGFYYSGKPLVVKKQRMGSVSASSSDLPNRGSNTEMLNRIVRGEKESNSSWLLINDSYGGPDPHWQSGVLRTNCIDCLDRTNVAQYAYGLAALGRQLYTMGLTDVPKVDPDSSIAAALMDMYQGMGDALAQQYGGSAAHNTVFPDKQGKWKATTQSQEFLKSIKRYYSNAYTDGEKQDAMNLFLGYFKPQEGRPALWELDSDYYLHISGFGDDINPAASSTQDFQSEPVGIRPSLDPVPACKEDFSRIRLTSFDKLIDKTCSSIRNVRLCSEHDQKHARIAGTSGVAPDAAEIQLKSPNWLFGHRKYQEAGLPVKLASDETASAASQSEANVDGSFDLEWLLIHDDTAKENTYQSYLAFTSANESNGWFGGTLLGDQDEKNEIYKHYAELCQGPSVEPFDNDCDKEKHYANVLQTDMIAIIDNTAVEAELEADFRMYDEIGKNLGIALSCKSLAGDPSQLTRWIIGEENVLKS